MGKESTGRTISTRYDRLSEREENLIRNTARELYLAMDMDVSYVSKVTRELLIDYYRAMGKLRNEKD